MGFFDKIGEVWDSIKHTGAPLGSAFSAATDSTLGRALIAADSVVNPLGTLTMFGADRFQQGQAAALQVPAAPVNTLGRGLTTAGLMGPNHEGSILDTDAWKRAWSLTGDHEVDGKTVEGLSFGQYVTGDVGRSLGGTDRLSSLGDLQDDSKSAEDRNQYFHNSWSGKLTSGSVDLALNLFADPTIAGTMAGKAAMVSRVTLKEGEATSVLAAARGAEAGSKRTERMATKVNDFANWVTAPKADGVRLSAAEIARHPAVAESPEKGTLSYLLSQARDHEEARTLIGASLGDSNSIVALAEKNAYLAEDMRRLTEAPTQANVAQHFSWDDHGQGMLDLANKTPAREVLLQRDEIVKEMTRLDRVLEAAGSTGRISGGIAIDDGLQVSTLRTGLAGRAITVVKGSLASRLDGHVNLADPVKGYDQLDKVLQQAPYVTGKQRNEMLSQFAGAATQGDRQGAVRRAEAMIVQTTGERYGLTPEQIQKVMSLGQGRRDVYANMLKGRLYSAAPDDKFVHLVDPEWDNVIARDTASMRSQVEDHHPIIDPRDFDQFVKAGSNSRLFEHMMRFGFGDAAKGQLAADKVYSVTDPVREHVGTMLMWGTRLWKDAMLLPRFAAYSVRTQVDSQGRLMAHMGALNYMPLLMGKDGIMRSTGRMIASNGVFGEADYEKVLKPFLKRHVGVDNDADIEQIVRNIKAAGGSHADLANEVANHTLQQMRASGSWGVVQPDDPMHADAYLRAVNRQIRNSPTAMKAAEGASLDELREFALNDKAGMAEWAELNGSWSHDVDKWLARVQTDTKYLLPTTELGQTALSRKLTLEDYKKAFGKQSGIAPMPVHGESYFPTNKDGIAKLAAWYEKSRNHLYALVSDAPETVMAKAPLYAFEYNRQMQRIVGNLATEMIDQRTLTAARRQADRIARRNVGKILFDSSDISNLGHTFRFVSPFWGAWEDMMKKWGSLIYENPQVAERFRQAWDAPNQMGIVADEYGNRVDADGNRFDAHTGQLVTDDALKGKQELMVIPIGAILGRAGKPGRSLRKLIGDPQDFRVNKKGFNVIFQGDPFWLPGAGPLAQIPANEVAKHAWPEAENNPVMQWLLPFGPTDKGISEQLMPAWARQMRNSFGGTSDYAQQMDQLYKISYAKWVAGGKVGPQPSVDQAAHQTKNWFLLRALMSGTLPISTTPSPQLQFYTDQAHIYQQKFGDPTKSDAYKTELKTYTEKYGEKTAKQRLLVDHPEYTDWQTRYFRDFPQYYDLAISSSVTETGLNMNLASVDAFKKYRKDIAQTPEWGWAFAGPDTAYGLDDEHKYSGWARTYELTTQTGPGGETIRKELSPTEALAKAEESKGWKDYQRVRTLINLRLEERGLTSLQQSGAEDLADVWSGFRDKLSTENPYWSRAYGQRDENKVASFLTDMKSAMAGNKDLADRGDMKALSQYIQVRQLVQAQMRERGIGSLDSQDAADLAETWNRFTLALCSESPGFEQVFNRMLDSDKLTGVVG